MQIIGPLARTVGDVEVALHVIAGPDGIDPLAGSVPLPWSRESSVRTVAVWDGPAPPGVRADVRAVVRAAADRLSRLGFDVADDAPSLLDRAVSLYSELRDTDRLQDVRRLVRGREDEVGEDVRAAIAAAVEADRRDPHPDRAALWEERDRLLAEIASFLERRRVLVMPVATVPPYPLDGPPPVVDGREHSTWDVLAPCRLISLFGVPAASVPFGASSEGLPIGVQVVGRPFREDDVLAVAKVLMEVTG
jgi:Asp-tRNA(Asn)/Glu-tRNA(Gln) amidotransferase A subunit family amidase